MPTPRVCEDAPTHVVGIDISCASFSFCVLATDKRLVLKPRDLPNTPTGYASLQHQLGNLQLESTATLLGIEATGRYWENLYAALTAQGYPVQLLHPAQTHQFAQQRGVRAKTDHIDAVTIARLLLSGEARPAYVPDEVVLTYRELVRLHTNLSAEAARYKTEIQDLLVVVFPTFRQVFSNPTAATALALLQQYPSPGAMLTAGVERLAELLHQLAPRRYGRATAQQLITLAEQAQSRLTGHAARARSLAILCDQLRHTQANLAQLEADLAQLLQADQVAQQLQSVPEFGLKTVAVLRAELGEIARFHDVDQAIAYVGLDLVVRQSGRWQGQRKLSKRGSGHLRKILYMAAVRSLARPDSAFRGYYQHLVERGLSKMSALTAVMRKMVRVAYGILKTGTTYDAQRVWARAKPQPAPLSVPAGA